MKDHMTDSELDGQVSHMPGTGQSAQRAPRKQQNIIVLSTSIQARQGNFPQWPLEPPDLSHDRLGSESLSFSGGPPYLPRAYGRLAPRFQVEALYVGPALDPLRSSINSIVPRARDVHHKSAIPSSLFPFL